MGSQKAGRDLATEQQQHTIFTGAKGDRTKSYSTDEQRQLADYYLFC